MKLAEIALSLANTAVWYLEGKVATAQPSTFPFPPDCKHAYWDGYCVDCGKPEPVEQHAGRLRVWYYRRLHRVALDRDELPRVNLMRRKGG